MKGFEILCVTLQREFEQEIYQDLFKKLLEIDDHFDCIPSVKYQLHGLQKAADPIQLFIFCLNKNVVKQTFKQKSEFDVIRISSVSLTDVWREADRWNLVYCICWLDEYTLRKGNKGQQAVSLFLACIPPSTISSSIVVVPNKISPEVVIEPLFHSKATKKFANATQINQLSGRLSRLCTERMMSVKRNTSCVLDCVKSNVLSRETLSSICEDILNLELKQKPSLGKSLFTPTHEDILNIVVKQNPNVDQILLERSINSVLLRRKIIQGAMVLFVVLFVLFPICGKFPISFSLHLVLILPLFVFVIRKCVDKHSCIRNAMYEYNECITKLRKKVECIEEIFHSRILSHNVNKDANMDKQKVVKNYILGQTHIDYIINMFVIVMIYFTVYNFSDF